MLAVRFFCTHCDRYVTLRPQDAVCPDCRRFECLTDNEPAPVSEALTLLGYEE